MKRSKKKANERAERIDVFVLRPSALQKVETQPREPFVWVGDEEFLAAHYGGPEND